MEVCNGQHSNYLHISSPPPPAKKHTFTDTPTHRGHATVTIFCLGLWSYLFVTNTPWAPWTFSHISGYARMWDTTTVRCLQLQMVHARVKMAWKRPAVVIFTRFPKYAIHIIMPKTKALKSPPLSMRRSLEPPVLQYNGGVSLCNKLNFSQFTWQCKTSILRISHGKHLKFSVPACHGLEAESKCVFKHVACWCCCRVHLTVKKTWKSSGNKVMLAQTSIHPQGPHLLGKSCPPSPSFPVAGRQSQTAGQPNPYLMRKY